MAGSIEKRGKDTYRLVYFCGKNLDGSPARHTKTVHCTKKEANLELAKFVADIEKGNVIEGNSITFEEFVEIWYCKIYCQHQKIKKMIKSKIKKFIEIYSI